MYLALAAPVVVGEIGEFLYTRSAGGYPYAYTVNEQLALLPLNIGPGRSPVDVRTAAYIRRDVLENAQRAISEDEFKAAVKPEKK